MNKVKEAAEMPIGPNGEKLKDVLRALLTTPVPKKKAKRKRAKR